jgi:hypothetical protein
MTLYAGLSKAYGTYRVTGVDKGKRVGKAETLLEEVTEAVWQGHLDGERGIGVVPIRDDSTCVFGAVDIDVYAGLDHAKVIKAARARRFPLVPCRSKSGGLHLYLFSGAPVEAALMRDKLAEMAASIGYGGSEVFPKQSRILAERGDVGSWINMPYFDAAKTERPGLGDDGSPLTLDAFLAFAEASRCDLAAVDVTTARSAGDLADGPPCLQHLAEAGVQEHEGRNAFMFAVCAYLKRAVPTAWQRKAEELNAVFCRPPLTLQEIAGVIGSANKRGYLYKCKEPPLKEHCDAGACRTRRFGVGAEGDFPPLTGLTRYDTEPPTWFVDVDGGGRIELTTDDLQQQTRFQRRCMDCLNTMPPALKVEQWRGLVMSLMEKMTLIKAPPGASAKGQLIDHLEQFCAGRSQARAKEEILLGKPWTDNGYHYFRMQDLSKYLEQQRFREFKVHQIARILRDVGGKNEFMKLRNKGVNVWVVGEFERPDDGEMALPELGGRGTI